MRAAQRNQVDDAGARASRALLEAHGGDIVRHVLIASLFHHSVRHYTRDMAEILSLLKDVAGVEQCTRWLHAACASIPARAGLGATQEQLNAFCNAVVQYVRATYSTCRLLKQ